MIRQEIRLTIEGDIEHTVATSLIAIGLAKRRHPRIKELWSLDRREQFLQYTEYPGLPDLMYTQLEDDGHQRTYAVEVETDLTPKTFDRKQLQFKRFGVNDVFVIDLKKMKPEDRTNWVLLQKYLLERLP